MCGMHFLCQNDLKALNAFYQPKICSSSPAHCAFSPQQTSKVSITEWDHCILKNKKEYFEPIGGAICPIFHEYSFRLKVATPVYSPVVSLQSSIRLKRLMASWFSQLHFNHLSYAGRTVTLSLQIQHKSSN